MVFQPNNLISTNLIKKKLFYYFKMDNPTTEQINHEEGKPISPRIRTIF